MSINPATLRNKGAKIKLAEIKPVVKIKKRYEPGDDGNVVTHEDRRIVYEVQTDDDGFPIVVTEWVKFTNASLAEIQTHFGSMEAFQQMAETRPNETIAKGLVAMLDGQLSDTEEVAQMHLRILPEEMTTYQTTMMAMMALANGVDPSQAAQMIEEGIKATRLALEDAADEMDKALAEMRAEIAEAEAERATRSEDESTSTSSSPDGSESDDSTPSSGS